MTDLSRIPQVDALLREPDAEPILEAYGRRPTTTAIRLILSEVREEARAGHPIPPTDELLSAVARDLADRRSGDIRRVVNATGVVVHTNLGRAPLSRDARDAMVEATGYASLEYDLEAGRRGSRTRYLGDLAAEACGAEAATVVNNGAAAVVLVLAALATGREAIVSRGELVEIGGSFRLPDVMAGSGAELHEVGTTNRTRLEDYRAAISDRTGVILKVHRSNYQVVGFTAEPSVTEIAELADDEDVPFVYDIGSGLLRDPGRGPFAEEPSAAGALRDGADLVVFSGDKLLGGPQAGIIAGRGDLVMACSRHPLARALRIDKFRRAALEATFESHLRSDLPLDLPVWAMMTVHPDELRRRAEAIADGIGGKARADQTVSVTGGGSLPGAELESWAVVLDVGDPEQLAATLRDHDPPVITRVESGTVVMDLRTVPPAQDGLVRDAVIAALDRLRG